MNRRSSGSARRSSTRGFLGRTARAELAAQLVRYADTARSLGAADVTFLGTEPIRRAADAARDRQRRGRDRRRAVARAVARGGGLPDDHRRDRGDAGHPRDARHRCRWRQLGILHRRRHAAAACGRSPARVGAADGPVRDARSTDADEVAAIRAAAVDALRGAPDASPAEIIAVGGTASNLVKMLPEAIADRTLTRERIARIQAILATEHAAATSAAPRRQSRPGAAPAGRRRDRRRDPRALRRGSHPRLRGGPARGRRSSRVDHAGPCWRDRLSDLAHGWRT